MPGEDQSLTGSLSNTFGFFKKKKSPSPDSRSTSNEQSVSRDFMDMDGIPPLTPLSLQGYKDSTKNRLLSTELGDEIRNILPARLQISSDWKLLYSLEQHGSSLNTLYSNTKPNSTRYDKGGYLLVIKDEKNGIFGSYTNEYFHPTDLKRFYGNGECFLWKSKTIKNKDENGQDEEGSHIQFQAFPYTGLNEFTIYCTSQFLSLGGGDGHYGLWIDHDLLHGVSDHSLTFGNEPLSAQGTKFGILGVELWKVGS